MAWEAPAVGCWLLPRIPCALAFVAGELSSRGAKRGASSTETALHGTASRCGSLRPLLPAIRHLFRSAAFGCARLRTPKFADTEEVTGSIPVSPTTKAPA
jgi:hypothetical protein